MVGIETSAQDTNNAGIFPEKEAIVAMTGFIELVFTNVKPNIKSLKHHANCVINKTASCAFDIGKNMLNSIRNLLAPSIKADSIISLGMLIKWFLNKNIAKGMHIAM